MPNPSQSSSRTYGDANTSQTPIQPTQRVDQQLEYISTYQPLAGVQTPAEAEQYPTVLDEAMEDQWQDTERFQVQNYDQDWADETDSAIDSAEVASSTMSVGQSIYESVEEFGRTYHSYKSGKYSLPNDEKEQDRLDLQHAMFTLLIGNRLSVAPIDKIPLHNVLDIATGTGVWAIEFADAHPSTHVIGTDLSPIQPNYVPPNCTFEVDDAEDEWLFKEPFSYIHARAVLTCFKDPLNVIQSAYNALSPGGILEFQDPQLPFEFADPQPTEDSPFVLWQKLILESGEKSGRRWTNVPRYKEWFQEVGFVDVHVEKFLIPTGPWHEDTHLRKVGMWQLGNWLEAIDSITPKMLNRLGWEIEESKILAAQVRDELLKDKVRPYCDFSCVWGRKPELAGHSSTT